MNRPRITQVEVHVSHACNFTCESCTHFSQEGHSGRETPESFRGMVGPWPKRLQPRNVLLLGGEPTLNPQLAEVIEVARDLWPEPEVRLMLVTNGWFLHRHPRLPEVIKRCGVQLNVSIHHDDPRYLAKLEEVKVLAESWGVPIRWRESFRDWTRAYRGEGADAQPFQDGDPRSSWHECVSKWCMTIRDGKLWKCPMVAWLPMHAEKYGSGGWEEYLRYQPLSPDCPDEALHEFIHRGHESCCGMCPARPEQVKKSYPVRGSSRSTSLEVV